MNGDIQNHDRNHVEGIHQKISRKQIPENPSDGQDPVTQHHSIKSRGSQLSPEADQQIHSHDQKKEHLDVENQICGTAVIALPVNRKDCPCKEAAQADERKEDQQDNACIDIAFPSASLCIDQHSRVCIKKEAPYIKEEEKQHVYDVQKPYRK